MSGTYASAEFMTVRTDKSPKAISGQKMNLNEALVEQQHSTRIHTSLLLHHCHGILDYRVHACFYVTHYNDGIPL